MTNPVAVGDLPPKTPSCWAAVSDCAVGVGSAETSGLAEAELALNWAAAVGSVVVGRRGDERRVEGRDGDTLVEGP